MAKERSQKKMAQGSPAKKKMNPILKGTLIGTGIGALGTTALINQASIREGHATYAEGQVRRLDQDLKNIRTLPIGARNFQEERLLEFELTHAQKHAATYAPAEMKKAAALRSAAKYPIPAGAALGAGLGALSAWRQKRRAKQPRRVQHRR